MKGNHKYTDHYDEWARLYTEEKMPATEIAKKFGTCQQTVSRALNRMGVDVVQGRRQRSVEDRFWEYVINNGPEECWGWSRAISPTGYPYISEGKSPRRASHVSPEIHGINIPDGKIVCHKCDNRECTNPNHLYVGTHQNNTDDMMRRGRSNPPVGERAGNSKLTRDQVRFIKRAASDPSLSQYDLADMFNVTQSNISRIQAGDRWGHMEINA